MAFLSSPVTTCHDWGTGSTRLNQLLLRHIAVAASRMFRSSFGFHSQSVSIVILPDVRELPVHDPRPANSQSAPEMSRDMPCHSLASYTSPLDVTFGPPIYIHRPPSYGSIGEDLSLCHDLQHSTRRYTSLTDFQAITGLLIWIPYTFTSLHSFR